MDRKSDLKSIDGGRPANKSRAGRRRSLQDSEQATCWRCLQVKGVESSAVVPVTLGPRRKPDGRKTGGTKIWACVRCIADGEIIEVVRD